MNKKVIIIGAGFAGLSCACHLAKAGYNVTVLEKNERAGGRASLFEADGFKFDMGPSWYWMPDIFERFFGQFGKRVDDYYQLIRLDPGYRINFNNNEHIDVPASLPEIYEVFESIEPGCTANLDKFLEEAAYKYKVGINEFVFKPGHSVFEYFDLRILRAAIRLQMFKSLASHVDELFQHEHLRLLLKFPVLFLGATAKKIPAMYSMMNYADLALGTWYPKGGMYEIIKAMVLLAESLGVTIRYDEPAKHIKVANKQATTVTTDKGEFTADIVVGGADYHHVDRHLLDHEYSNYSESYWQSRDMAPSSLLYYVGVDKQLENLLHHNLFFDKDFDQHAMEVYEQPKWPEKPLFYVCCPSKTDTTVAPEGKENLFILIPTAPGLTGDTEEVRNKYFDIVIKRMEKITGQAIEKHIIYKRSFAHKEFIERYNSFKGNAYGLANTLRQTAMFKPKIKNKKVNNLYYTGQLTVPGPGVPPSLISGEVVANEIIQSFKNNR